ncbi:MAG: biotin--[acetyl-CoA-carboxylase] ligase [Actinobacteria bacterium]|nr:biotin--[acetyl-CoA-carboxylase] ligase [Actinomycetota bacterium]
MDQSRARSALKGTRFSHFCWVLETGSTNADLLDAARRGESEQVLATDFQSAGRGRLGRPWSAGPGASVLCSMLIRPDGTFDNPHLATAAVGLAAAEAVEALTGRRVGIKWPNDLVAGTSDAPDDRKLAGILAEAVIGSEGIEAVVVGIGLNANWPEIPEELSAAATAINHLVGAPVDRTDLVIELVRRVGEHLDALKVDGGAERLHAAIAERSATLGRRVRVELPDGEIIGLATGFTVEGALVVDVDGATTVVSVGDITHLRPLS